MNIKNDKKGFVFTAGAAVFFLILIAGITGLIAFLTSGTLRWVIIGIAVMVGFVYILGQAIKSDTGFTKGKVIALLVFLGVGLFFVLGADVLQSQFDSDTVWIAENGRFKCEEDSVHQEIIKYADENYEFTCGEDYVVDECRVFVSCFGTSFLNKGCGGSNPIWKVFASQFAPLLEQGIDEGTHNRLFTTLSPGDKIDIFTEDIRNADNLEIKYNFNPYRLKVIESGAEFIGSSSDCCLANQNKLQKDQFKAGDWECVDKGTTKNYFVGWTPLFGFKTYNYQGRQVLCGTNSLYEFDSISLANGRTRKIQGERIKFVECCPHQDDNCDSSAFTFKEIGQEETRECTYDYQCNNLGIPVAISSSEAVEAFCDDGTCKDRVLDIECANDFDCRQLKGEGYGCNLAPNNFGKCILIGKIEQEFCGDTFCNIQENAENCPEDCDQSPKTKSTCERWYESSFSSTKEDCGTLGYKKIMPFVNCETITEDGCRTSGWIYWAIGGLVLITIVLILIPKRKRGRKKK